jgi:hypothetical protein
LCSHVWSVTSNPGLFGAKIQQILRKEEILNEIGAGALHQFLSKFQSFLFKNFLKNPQLKNNCRKKMSNRKPGISQTIIFISKVQHENKINEFLPFIIFLFSNRAL